MKEKSLGKNAVLNILKNLMSIIFPLVTYPYVSSVLSVEALGGYSFSRSVIDCFLMIAALGISSYAVREGARLRENKAAFSCFALNILVFNFLSMILTYILLVLCIQSISGLWEYKEKILVFSLEILFATIGVEWLFIIYEEYTYITIRKILFQIISICLLLIFVKNSEDVMSYVWITVFANAGANILNIIRVGQYCDFRQRFDLDLKKHIRPILIIFGSTLAIKIYTSSDIILLGLLSGDYAVGIYSIAVKIYNVLKSLLVAAMIVSIPRLASYIGNHEYEKYVTLLNKIFNVLIIFVLPSVIGIFMLSKNIILLLSNEQYLASSIILKVLSIAIMFSVFSSFFNQCMLLPLKLERYFLIGTIISAIINLILNIFLIPVYGALGAAITTMISEWISMFICYYAGRNKVKLNYNLHTYSTVLLGCLGIIASCKILSLLEIGEITLLVLSIFTSTIVYFVILAITKNEIYTQCYSEVMQKLWNTKR